MMKRKERQLILMLADIAREEGLQLRTWSDGWIAELIRDGRSLFVYGYKFPNNHATVDFICDDKACLSMLLADHGIPAVPHVFFPDPAFDPYTDPVRDEAKKKALLAEWGRVVVKPNQGTGGYEVERADTWNGLEEAIARIYRFFNACAVSPYRTIAHEYRVILLNGEPRVMYEKIRPEEAGIWKHNLGLGAKPEPVRDPGTAQELEQLALRAADLLGARFVSVDIIDGDRGYEILEINSGVMMEAFAGASEENHAIACAIYRDAVLSWFAAGA